MSLESQPPPLWSLLRSSHLAFDIKTRPEVLSMRMRGRDEEHKDPQTCVCFVHLFLQWLPSVIISSEIFSHAFSSFFWSAGSRLDSGWILSRTPNSVPYWPGQRKIVVNGLGQWVGRPGHSQVHSLIERKSRSSQAKLLDQFSLSWPLVRDFDTD